MNTSQRFHALMSFKPVDRLPMIEWAPWWGETLTRWYGEGLPCELTDRVDIAEYLGLDSYRRVRVEPLAVTCPEPESHGAPLVRNADEYHDLGPHLYPEGPFDRAELEVSAARQKAGDLVVWIALDGFFWYPRTLLGIEPHLYAFYDDPELMHAMNRDLLAFNLRAIDQVCEILTPDFVALNEDMSYNHGPMISKDCFDAFLTPYYREFIPMLKEGDILPFIDSDGDVTTMIPWLEEVGIEGVFLLERMAGVDVAQIRRDHPRFRLIGAFDKTVMHRGEDTHHASRITN